MGGTFDAIEVVHKTLFEFYLAAHCFKCVNRSRQTGNMDSEELLRCSICRDVFKNPATIPCGHNYCLDCIKNHWDTRKTCECPTCKRAFKRRPNLRVNWILRDFTEHKRTPGTSKDRPTSGNDSNVPCQGATSSATKLSVISRQWSFGNAQTPVLCAGPTSAFYETRSESQGKFTRTDRRAVSMKSTRTEDKIPEINPRESESTETVDQLQKTEKEFKDMIQAGKRKAEEIQALVKQCKEETDDEIQTSVQFMAMVRRAVDTHESLLQVEIKQQQVELEQTSKQLLKKILEEIDELQRKRGELQHLTDIMGPFQITQRLQSLTASQSTTDWSHVKLQTDNHIGTARSIFATLADLCHKIENQLCAEEVTRVKKYAVDITLDPATAAAWLLLSPDGKQVSLGGQQQRVSVHNNNLRFDSCAAVLGKQSFSTGRRYWIVQVGDKTDWDLGVVRESISRSGLITVRPDRGFWAICRRKGGSIIACAGPSFPLQLGENPKKVGVFLDYEKGSVTFYDTEAKIHIYTYSGCNFTEPLYPYFNPCHHENGKNVAPLIICPVKP